MTFVKGGYIAVEFFFIVSGFYMAKKAFKKQTKNIGKETIEYIWNFLKKLIPYILISFIIIFTIKIIYESHKTYEWINSIWNVLLLRQAGFSSLLFGVDPFNQPGVEVYKQEVRDNLKLD